MPTRGRRRDQSPKAVDGRRVERARIERGLLQEELSEAAGYSGSNAAISRLETGSRGQAVAAWRIAAVAEALKVPVEWLYGEGDDKVPEPIEAPAPETFIANLDTEINAAAERLGGAQGARLLAIWQQAQRFLTDPGTAPRASGRPRRPRGSNPSPDGGASEAPRGRSRNQ